MLKHFNHKQFKEVMHKNTFYLLQQEPGI